VSTPTLNLVPAISYDPSGRGAISALLEGVKWGIVFGAGIDLTFSFPAGTASFVTPYGQYANSPLDGFTGKGEFDHAQSLSSAEQAAVRSVLAIWSSIADVSFTEVADNSTVVGDLRFAKTTVVDPSEEAHTYYPSNNPDGGDVWLRRGVWDNNHNVSPGTYSYMTLIHEIGHALGLKHPFEGTDQLPSSLDNYSLTVMSYSAYSGGDNYASFYPTTPMFFDIEAMQALYGRRSHNPGNTVYTFHDSQHYWQTIDDSGGTDKIVHVGSAQAVIDLQVGHWSKLGLPIRFDDHAPQRDTVMIGPKTFIENATGGSGRDQIIGNDLANQLDGGAGRNLLTGNGGPDHFIFRTGLESTFDRVTDFAPGVDTISLSQKIFIGVGAVGHTLEQAEFHIGPHFSNSAQRIDYDPEDGWLWYSPHGDQAHQTHFMTLSARLDLHHSDIFVIA
jgi:serralysin